MHAMTVQWLAVLAFVFSTLGCSTSSDQSTGDSRPASNRWAADAKPAGSDKPIGLLIEPGPAAELGYRISWASPIELLRGQELLSVTVLGDMIITIESPENFITALRASDGQAMWKIKLGSRLETFYPPNRDGEQIFIHSGSRFFTLRDRDGEVQAVAKLETSVASPAVYDPLTRLAILSGSNGLVFGHSVDSNFARWRYDMDSRITNPPALAQQDVFIVDTGGTYAMLETSTGKPLWRNRTLGAVRAAPTVQGSEIVVASEDGKLYAFNRTTGKDTWQYLGAEQPLVSAPVALGRLIIQPLQPKGGLVAVNAIDGKEVWRNDINALPVLIRQQDMLLHSDSELFSVDLDAGDLLTRVPTLELKTVIPVGDDGSIILVSPNGRLLRLKPL